MYVNERVRWLEGKQPGLICDDIFQLTTHATTERGLPGRGGGPEAAERAGAAGRCQVDRWKGQKAMWIEVWTCGFEAGVFERKRVIIRGKKETKSVRVHGQQTSAGLTPRPMLSLLLLLLLLDDNNEL
jgi:hypothetical protein